jgi:hypothetical protein
LQNRPQHQGLTAVRKEFKLRPKRTEEPDGVLSSGVLVADGSAWIQSQPAADELTQDTALWNESRLISVEPELSTSGQHADKNRPRFHPLPILSSTTFFPYIDYLVLHRTLIYTLYLIHLAWMIFKESCLLAVDYLQVTRHSKFQNGMRFLQVHLIF